MERPEKRPGAYALNEGEGWIYRLGVDFHVKAGERSHDAGAAVFEYATKKGEEPEDHIHETEDEMFYVLDGSVSFRCGQKAFSLERGGFVFLPRGIQHGYTVRSAAPARLLVITAPTRDRPGSGWGGFVSDLEAGQGDLIAEPPRA